MSVRIYARLYDNGIVKVEYFAVEKVTARDRTEYWYYPHSMRSRVYDTVKCQYVYLSDPSVCLSHRSTAAVACGGFAAERPTGKRYRLIAGAGAQQQRRTAADAGSVALTTEGRGWTQTCLVRGYFVRKLSYSDTHTHTHTHTRTRTRTHTHTHTHARTHAHTHTGSIALLVVDLDH